MTPNPQQTVCTILSTVNAGVKACTSNVSSPTTSTYSFPSTSVHSSPSTSSYFQAQYVMCKDLYKCLSTVNSDLKFVLTMKEVNDALRNYVYQKRLYDPKCPIIIRCKEDELAKVFGVSDFTIMDVNRLLKKRVFPVDCKDSCDASCCSNITNRGEKRKLEGEEAAEEATNLFEDIKKICLSSELRPCKHGLSQQAVSFSPMVLQIPSPVKGESDGAESVHSYQGYETALAKDTSDDLWSTDDDEVCLPEGSVVAIEETYDIEYEIASDSGSNIESVDSDSEIEEVIRVMSQRNGQDVRSAVIKVICKTDSDQEFWADDSSDELGDSHSDAELSEQDKWKCKSCSNCNDPLMGCCQKCWRTRSGWLADPKVFPKRKKPRSKKRYQRSSEPFRNKKEDPTSSCEQNDLPSTSQESLYSVSSVSSQEACASVSKLCLLCCSKPVDSSIVHGKFAHSVSCYRCGRKLKHNKKPCPICRRTIERVVYNMC